MRPYTSVTKFPYVIYFLALLFLLSLGFNLPADAEQSTSPAAAGAIQPLDVKGHWAEPHISEWLNLGLIKGYPDNTFKPDQQVSRAEFMTMVNRVFGYTATSLVQFKDVADGDWFAAEIAKAQAASYISGYQDGTIRPNAAVSRQEAASILVRIAKLQNPADSTTISKFKDNGDIPQWSRAAINAVVNQNLMQGYPDQTFQPTRNISRAEAIVTIHKVKNDKMLAQNQKIYDKAGTYGLADRMETIDGDVTISVSGVILQNIKINGNMILAKDIGNGDVTLRKVSVQGASTIEGGGDHSVTLEDCTLSRVTINKDGVRVVASGSTSVGLVQLESGAALEENNSSGPGFEEVNLTDKIPAGTKVTLNGTFSEVNVDAAKINVALTAGNIARLEVTAKANGASLNIASEAGINTLHLNAAASISGKGSINTATVSVAGSTFEQKPGSIENPNNVSVTTGVTPPLDSENGEGTGTGAGGGGGNNPLNFISSDPADGCTGISATPTIKLNFDRGVVRDYWDNNQNCISMTDNYGQPVSIRVYRASDYTADNEKRSIYVTPNSSLTAGSSYTIRVSAALKANNGNTLGTTQALSFTVAGSSGDGGGGSPVRILTISDGDGRSGINAPAPNGPSDGAQANRTVLTFKLTANAIENIIIPAGDSISINVSNISGLTQSDLTNVELFTDPNGDGKTSDGVSIAAGTLGAINDGNAAITFTLSALQTVAASNYMNYLVRLDTTANWGDGDTFTFAANSINITARGNTSQKTASVPGNITEQAFLNPPAEAGAPTFLSASVTTDGSVGVIFSKEMENTAALAGKAGQFTVNVDGEPATISSLGRASTTSKLKISLQTAITHGQVVTVEYTKDADADKWIKAEDGAVLESFSAQPVTN